MRQGQEGAIMYGGTHPPLLLTGPEAMGVEHLEGKRTGRPPGSRNRKKWQVETAWAHRHIGDDAPPPSPMAGLLRDLGREHPDRLIALVALDDGQRAVKPVAPQPRRLMRLSLRSAAVPLFLAGVAGRHRAELPAHFEVVKIEVDLKEERTVITVESEDLPAVADGAPVPTKRIEL